MSSFKIQITSISKTCQLRLEMVNITPTLLKRIASHFLCVCVKQHILVEYFDSVRVPKGKISLKISRWLY